MVIKVHRRAKAGSTAPKGFPGYRVKREDMTIFDVDWVTLSIAVVPEAIGENVIIECNFVSDGSRDSYSGLSIDNVGVDAD